METSQAPTHALRKVLVLLDNLFFAAKINQAASQTDVKPIYAKTSNQALEMARVELPCKIIVDLDSAICSPLDFIARLKADTTLQTIPIIGFVSHVNLNLQQQARQAGCDRVMARSAFDRNLIAVLSQNS